MVCVAAISSLVCLGVRSWTNTQKDDSYLLTARDLLAKITRWVLSTLQLLLYTVLLIPAIFIEPFVKETFSSMTTRAASAGKNAFQSFAAIFQWQRKKVERTRTWKGTINAFNKMLHTSYLKAVRLAQADKSTITVAASLAIIPIAYATFKVYNNFDTIDISVIRFNHSTSALKTFKNKIPLARNIFIGTLFICLIYSKKSFYKKLSC